MTSPRPLFSRIDWKNSLPFIAFHLASIGIVLGSLMGPYALGWRTLVGMIALCAASYVVRMFGITAGYHRYFAHRAYQTSRLGQFALAFLGGTALQKGALWWASNHRDHHRDSDTPQDIHSPVQQGFWWSHMLWILVNDYDHTDYERIRDLSKYPELRWLNRHHWVPGALYAAAFLAFGGWPGFCWGFVISTVVLWHGTFTINSLAHVYGKRRYETADTSRNNLWLSLLTLGEGWHNNHHRYMNSVRQGFYWWEIDMTYYILRTLEKFGCVWELREPPLEKL